jgi:hypothetical protein
MLSTKEVRSSKFKAMLTQRIEILL